VRITRISISLRPVWAPRIRRFASSFSAGLFGSNMGTTRFGALAGLRRRSGALLSGLWGGTSARVASWSMVCVLALTAVMVPGARGEKLYAPDFLWERGIAEKTDPIDVADAHLGIPYRDDGALDSQGRFTTFEDPTRVFDSPGLNCSGLVLSVCRFLYDKNWTLEQAMGDPQENSGPTSQLGKDWDFGLDLILNISQGGQRRALMPDGGQHAVSEFDGINARGFDLHDRAAWRAVLAQMQPGRAYLGSISKVASKPGYRVLHYHVVLMLPDSKGNVWLYHATHRSNVHKMNMNTAKGMGRFMSEFTGARDDGKRMIVVESVLPEIGVGAESTAGAAESPRAAAPLPDTRKVGAQTPTGVAVDTKVGVAAQVTPPADALPVGTEAPTEGEGNATRPTAPSREEKGPERVVNHLVGRVFKAVPGVNTAIPRFADDTKNAVRFRFTNETPVPRDLEIVLQGPDGEQRFSGKLGTDGSELLVRYPTDFGSVSAKPLQMGQYRADVKLDGVQWLADIFEVAVPREAAPKILRVSAPSTVQAGKPFTVKIEAVNGGAESDYGGITLSTPDPSGLRLRAATPGKLFPPGSTVLSVTSDRIRTKVPMAERWIELWGENATYDMTVKLEAGRPGTYPLYVRCALRGVNVKSSVILMDPKSAETVDQQGFPVYVHQIRVQ
jgi:hypothetical protein